MNITLHDATTGRPIRINTTGYAAADAGITGGRGTMVYQAGQTFQVSESIAQIEALGG